jgi:hypothetical protein
MRRKRKGFCQCGCGRKTAIAAQNRNGNLVGEPVQFLRGHNFSSKTRPPIKHGAARKGAWAPEYRTFWNAKMRCENPRVKCFPNYGGRGIKFLFTSYQEFFAAVGPRPKGLTLDRINNDGNYEPGNVRWATHQQQYANQRKPSRKRA